MEPRRAIILDSLSAIVRQAAADAMDCFDRRHPDPCDCKGAPDPLEGSGESEAVCPVLHGREADEFKELIQDFFLCLVDRLTSQRVCLRIALDFLLLNTARNASALTCHRDLLFRTVWWGPPPPPPVPPAPPDPDPMFPDHEKCCCGCCKECEKEKEKEEEDPDALDLDGLDVDDLDLDSDDDDDDYDEDEDGGEEEGEEEEEPHGSGCCCPCCEEKPVPEGCPGPPKPLTETLLRFAVKRCLIPSPFLHQQFSENVLTDPADPTSVARDPNGKLTNDYSDEACQILWSYYLMVLTRWLGDTSRRLTDSRIFVDKTVGLPASLIAGGTYREMGALRDLLYLPGNCAGDATYQGSTPWDTVQKLIGLTAPWPMGQLLNVLSRELHSVMEKQLPVSIPAPWLKGKC